MEFALVLPLLVTIVLGTIDWGWFFFVSQIVTNAAREGARIGSITPMETAANDARDTATAYLTGSGLPAGGTAAAVIVDDRIEVTVTYPAGSLTGFTTMVRILPLNAEAVAVMRR